MPEKKSGPGNGLTALGGQAGKGFHSSEEKEGESLVLKYLLASDGGGGVQSRPQTRRQHRHQAASLGRSGFMSLETL